VGWCPQCKGRALDEEGMKKEAAVFRAAMDEARARELLRSLTADNPFADLIPQTKWDENVAMAKQFLRDATEKWDAAGNTAEEERVRTWEKNVKTKAEFLASVPDWARSRTPSSDSSAGVKEAKAAAEQQRTRQEWGGEEEQCREPLRYPPVKWDHQTEFGKTFADQN
jgi:hypothetical protein